MKDKIVGQIYESYDYDQFKIIKENRGRSETHGINIRKLNSLQTLIESKQYVEEYGIVKVNKDFLIVDGRHTFEIMQRNKLPIRYIIIGDDRFNNATKNEMLNSVYTVNKINTSWNGHELFNAACQRKGPLAVAINEIIDKHDNTFKWNDVMALIIKNLDMFRGRFHIAQINLLTFWKAEYVDYINSNEFAEELKWFVKFNEKARVAYHKGSVLMSFYSVLWNARSFVNPMNFRKSCLSIPDTTLQSQQTRKANFLVSALIKNYNRKFGQSVVLSTVLYQLSGNGQSEEIEL